MILVLNLIEMNSVVREGPIDLRSFEKLVQDGIDGLLAGHAVGDELIFQPSDFGNQPHHFLLPFPF